MTKNLLAAGLLTFSAVATLAAADEPATAAGEDIRQMQGEWIVVSSERDGQAAPEREIASIRRKVSGKTIEVELAGQEGIVTLTSDFTLDATKDPKTIDVVRKDGPSQGVPTLAIYELKDGELRICSAPPGQPRPTSFETKPGTGHTMTVWKRAEPLANAAGGDFETRALEVLRKLSEHIRKAQSLQTSATIVTTVRDGDQSRRFEVTAEIAAMRPDKFSFQSKVDGVDKSGLTVIANGERLTTLVKDRNEFVQVEGETPLGGVAEPLIRLGHVNVGVLFPNLLSDDPYRTLLDGVTRCVYAGIERRDGKPLHYLRFKQDPLSWELWVSAEGEPLVHRLVSRSVGEGPSVVTVEEYRNWRFDTAPAAESFQFTPPAGAQRVDDLRPQG
jgi:uncharacterized protein (TIGR03067 family)